MMQKRVVWMWQLSHAGRLTFIWFLELVSVTFQCLAGPRQGHGFSVRNHTSRVYTTCKLRNQTLQRVSLRRLLYRLRKHWFYNWSLDFAWGNYIGVGTGRGLLFAKLDITINKTFFFFCLLRFLRSIVPLPYTLLICFQRHWIKWEQFGIIQFYGFFF